MSERKYYHILSTGEVREITNKEWYKIVREEDGKFNRTRRVVTIYKNEITFDKGYQHAFIKKEWLDQIFDSKKEAK